MANAEMTSVWVDLPTVSSAVLRPTNPTNRDKYMPKFMKIITISVVPVKWPDNAIVFVTYLPQIPVTCSSDLPQATTCIYEAFANDFDSSKLVTYSYSSSSLEFTQYLH